MTREEIIQKTNEALSKEFELSIEQLRPEASFQTDLGLDSLDAVDMVVVLEQKLKDFWNILLPIDFYLLIPNPNFCLSYKTSF